MTAVRITGQRVSGNEEWRDVVGWEGYYQISNHGRLKSLARTIYRDVPVKGPGKWSYRHVAEKIIKAIWNGSYYVATLCRPGEEKQHHIHRLVLETFIGPRPHGMEGCHNDGNPKNNYASNLRWDTFKKNQADRRRHGTDLAGRNGLSWKLKERYDEVLELARTGNHTYKQLAAIFSVTVPTYQSNIETSRLSQKEKKRQCLEIIS